MAFEKTIESSTGAPATYHRIPSLTIDFNNKIARGVIASFYTKEARDANKGALGSNEFTMHGKQFPFTEEQHQAVRSLLGLTEAQELVNLQAYYDGGSAFCKAVIGIEIMGNPVQSEMQFQVAKDALPDFLAITYARVALDAPFNDAEQA